MHAKVDGCVAVIEYCTVLDNEMLLTVENSYQVDLQGCELGRDGLAIYDFQVPNTCTSCAFCDSRIWDLTFISTARTQNLMGEAVEGNIRTTMSTAPYCSNASSKRDSWSSQLTTLHLIAVAVLWRKWVSKSRVTRCTDSRKGRTRHLS